jgi:hypothetical protein
MRAAALPLQVLWGHARLSARPRDPWLAQLLSAASAQLASFSARDSAMLLWALAVLGHCPGRQVVAGLLGGVCLSSYKQKAANPQVSFGIGFVCWGLGCGEQPCCSQSCCCRRWRCLATAQGGRSWLACWGRGRGITVSYYKQKPVAVTNRDCCNCKQRAAAAQVLDCLRGR